MRLSILYLIMYCWDISSFGPLAGLSDKIDTRVENKNKFDLRNMYAMNILPKTIIIYYKYLKPCDPIQYNNHV